MNKYSTGEIAKLCDVSIRTVQYYDSINILVPSELSDGGRRLYNDKDLEKLKLICLLKKLGFSIKNIQELLKNNTSTDVLIQLISRQETLLKNESKAIDEKLTLINTIKKEIKNEQYSIESLTNIEDIIINKKKLRKVRINLLLMGLTVEAFELTSLLLGIFKKLWLPLFISIPITIIITTLLIIYYYREIDYVCYSCNHTFKPKIKDFLFANHTLTSRKLKCPCCNEEGFFIEKYRKEK